MKEGVKLASPALAAEKAASPSISKIEVHEEAQAKTLVAAHFRQATGRDFELRPGGYLIAVKVYIRPEELKEIQTDTGETVKLYLPDVARDQDKYQSVAALVMAMGPEAYKGDRYAGQEPWCKVGDWVVIPRYESFQLQYRGAVLGLLPDDKIMAVIDDPRDVMAAHLTDRH